MPRIDPAILEYQRKMDEYKEKINDQLNLLKGVVYDPYKKAKKINDIKEKELKKLIDDAGGDPDKLTRLLYEATWGNLKKVHTALKEGKYVGGTLRIVLAIAEADLGNTVAFQRV